MQRTERPHRPTSDALSCCTLFTGFEEITCLGGPESIIWPQQDTVMVTHGHVTHQRSCRLFYSCDFKEIEECLINGG